MLGAFEQLARLVDIRTSGNDELGQRDETRELRNALDALKHALDATLQVDPLEARRAAYGPERENEAVGKRGT